MEGVQTKMDNQWSSLTTSPGLGAAGTVDFAPQVTLGWWQACKHTKLLHNEDSSPICQSLLCKASWESEDLYGDYTGSAGGYMVEIESPNKSNAQGDQHTPITLIGSPIRGNRFQADVTVCSGPQPPFVESRDQPEYHTVGDPSLAAGRWFMDVETPSSIGHGSSRFSSSTVDDASRIFGPINCCAQQRPLHQNTASMEICLSSATCYSTYPSSPPSARYAPSITEEDHQRSIESASRTPESRRHAKDEFLIQAKQSGMSYREIRSKGHFKEAESTLRGRYRTLTKCREHRVRKPQWHTKDIQLLREAVVQVSVKSNSVQARQPSTVIDSTDRVVRSSKISWKQVAEYISLHDGTYHFGNATCRKKWDEISGRLPSRKTC